MSYPALAMHVTGVVLYEDTTTVQQPVLLRSQKELHIRQSKSDPVLLTLSASHSALYHYSDLENHNSLTPSAWDNSADSLGSQVNGQTDTNMLTIEGLRNHYNSCFTCGVSWYEDHVSLDCSECGGYAMQRPCPDCDGQCNSIWRRDLAASHDNRRAQWEGECKLTPGEKQQHQTFGSVMNASSNDIPLVAVDNFKSTL